MQLRYMCLKPQLKGKLFKTQFGGKCKYLKPQLKDKSSVICFNNNKDSYALNHNLDTYVLDHN